MLEALGAHIGADIAACVVLFIVQAMLAPLRRRIVCALSMILGRKPRAPLDAYRAPAAPPLRLYVPPTTPPPPVRVREVSGGYRGSSAPLPPMRTTAPGRIVGPQVPVRECKREGGQSGRWVDTEGGGRAFIGPQGPTGRTSAFVPSEYTRRDGESDAALLLRIYDAYFYAEYGPPPPPMAADCTQQVRK